MTKSIFRYQKFCPNIMCKCGAVVERKAGDPRDAGSRPTCVKPFLTDAAGLM